MSAFKPHLLSSRGFTLIEILIAIVILSFLTMGVISITQNSMDTMVRTTTLNRNNLHIETALSRFEWDFSQIYSPLYFSTVLKLGVADQNDNPDDPEGDGINNTTNQPIAPPAPLSPQLQEYYQRLIQRFEQNQHFSAVSKEGLPIPRFYSPDKNSFEFFTSSNRRKLQNMRQSHFAWVRYSIGEAVQRPEDERNELVPPGLKTLIRYFAADNPYDPERIDPENANQVKGAVLLENVESIEFSFWNMQTRKWETNLRAVPGGESALRGVKLSVTWYDSQGFKRTVARIYRNHWPMVVPQDTAAPAAGTAAGAQGGAAGAQGGAAGATGTTEESE